ncbi:MAG: hypothetical protein FWF46_07405 [Oscillospiraceae bacterium]|nr:hypothetical protein [Oscillospiraceae bacterium]
MSIVTVVETLSHVPIRTWILVLELIAIVVFSILYMIQIKKRKKLEKEVEELRERVNARIITGI